MIHYWLKVTLESDTALGRGDGVAGLVNAEVQHDSNGLPYLGGKTLKGLLTASCGEILYAFKQSNVQGDWDLVAGRLFGRPGSKQKERAILHVGAARLPADLRVAIAEEIADGRLKREEVLSTLTTIRRQTAMDAETGTPQDNTLRTIRVVLRETSFAARLDFLETPAHTDLALLTACVKSVRRIGTNRNRGMGRVSCSLFANEALAHPLSFSLSNWTTPEEVAA